MRVIGAALVHAHKAATRAQLILVTSSASRNNLFAWTRAPRVLAYLCIRADIPSCGRVCVRPPQANVDCRNRLSAGISCVSTLLTRRTQVPSGIWILSHSTYPAATR